MKNWRDLDKPEKPGIPLWALALMVICLLTIGGMIALWFSPIPGKVKRALKETFSEERVVEVEVPADEEAIRRQMESRLRSEILTERDRKIEQIQREAEAKIAAIREEQNELPVAPDFRLGKVEDIRTLRSGIPFITETDRQQGDLASVERELDDSYRIKYQLTLRVPKAAQTMEELQEISPELPKILPGIEPYLSKARVSGWFNLLYENKAARIQKQAHTFNKLLTKHNLYDCETILEFEGRNGRKVFLMQAEMDVVSDGSDGDRLATMPDKIVNSTHYQPFTSYGWKKRTNTPNPMIAGWKKRLAKGRAELNDPNTSADRKAWLRDRLKYLQRGIEDMKYRSFLIAEYDPFIVIPVNLLTSSKSYAPKVGDYAVVIYGDKVYPVIV
ncbi:MAG: glycoside hydrolase family 75 protein, partial [Akkermansiaceae bacterium]|nr:glycoside hydrolase family 75 protein [Akkermansiaceae bacterium]